MFTKLKILDGYNEEGDEAELDYGTSEEEEDEDEEDEDEGKNLF